MSRDDVFYLWGEENFLIDEEIKRIISLIREKSGEDPEILYMDADDLTPRELMETLEFSPLFSIQRIVIIKRPYWLGKSKRKNASADIQKVLNDYLQRENQGQTLIITADQANLTNPVGKVLNKNATVINCKMPGTQFLLKWIKKELEIRNCSIKPDAAELLAKSGQDMYYLQNLIDKLCLLLKDGTIEQGDVEEQLNKREEIKVFKLTDALLNRDAKGSLSAYYQLIAQGEHPLVSLRVITRQFMTLSKVKSYLEKGLNNKQIAELIGQKEFAVRKMAEKSRNFAWEEVRSVFTKLLQADLDLKSSAKSSDTIMEMFIIEVCSKK